MPATYTIPYQNLSIKIPADGEVFKWGDMVMKRVGNGIVQLGSQYENPKIQDIYNKVPEYPEANVLWTKAGFQLNQQPLGANSINQFQPGPASSGEVITQSINPTNPQGSVITSNQTGVLKTSPSLQEQTADLLDNRHQRKATHRILQFYLKRRRTGRI